MGSDKDTSDSSDSEASFSNDDNDDDDDDDDECSSSSEDSFVTVSSAESDPVERLSCSDVGKTEPPLTVGLTSLVIENSSAAASAAATEPTETVCQQLSSLTVSDEHQPTSSVSPLPQSHDNTPVQQ